VTDSVRSSSMWAAPDEALLAGLGLGDADATVTFVRRYQRRVFGLAQLIVGDDGLAEEVAQEAFVRAWRHAGSFDGRRGSVTTWLLSITRNLAIDAVRAQRSRPAVPTDPAALLRTDLAPDAAEAATAATEMTRVRAAIVRLPAEQRRALLFAALHGYTAREISELEGVPLGTAKTRIRSALFRLRDDLDVEESAG
jgi:RNA polymerase sigma factor (sigma-70 family)